MLLDLKHELPETSILSFMYSKLFLLSILSSLHFRARKMETCISSVIVVGVL